MDGTNFSAQLIMSFRLPTHTYFRESLLNNSSRRGLETLIKPIGVSWLWYRYWWGKRRRILQWESVVYEQSLATHHKLTRKKFASNSISFRCLLSRDFLRRVIIFIQIFLIDDLKNIRNWHVKTFYGFPYRFRSSNFNSMLIGFRRAIWGLTNPIFSILSTCRTIELV